MDVPMVLSVCLDLIIATSVLKDTTAKEPTRQIALDVEQENTVSMMHSLLKR